MSTSTDIATRPASVPGRDPVPSSYAEAIQVGAVLAKSGFFKDARQEAQAAAKVIAGMELGIGPMAAMTGIHVIDGKAAMGANLIAGQIKRSGRYDYQVVRLDDEACEIEFREGSKAIGTSTFTLADAQKAGLAGGANYKKYPRNMLFSRAMSNGARWYCADVFAGPPYTPDELGATVDGETGEVIDLPASPPPAPGSAPVDPAVEQGKAAYKDLAADYGADAVKAAARAAGAKSSRDFADGEVYGRVVAILEAPVPDPAPESGGVIAEKDRRALLAHANEHGLSKDDVKALAAELFGVDSTTKIPADRVDELRAAIIARVEGKAE